MNYTVGNLTVIIDDTTGHLRIDYRGKPIFKTKHLFLLELKENGSSSYVYSGNMQLAIYPNHSKLLLMWTGNGQVVCTTFEMEHDRLSMSADVLLTSGAVVKLHYPLLTSIGSIADTPDDDSMIIPWQNGFVVKNPAKNLIALESKPAFWAGRGFRKYENDYPAQFSYQFLYWYGTEGGIYLCTEDSDAHFKTFGLYSVTDQTFDMTVIHYPENSGEPQRYTLPYPIVLQGIDGDWQAAAATYRTWAIKQKWCAKGPLKERKIIKKLYDVDLWRINHQHQDCGKDYAEYLSTSLALKKQSGARLGLHWYGWNQTPHDTNYPEYIRLDEKNEITEKLFLINKTFDEHGIVKIPYVNARIIDQKGDHYHELHADPYIIQDENGCIPDEPWNNVSKMVPMCPSTEFWQDLVGSFCDDYYKTCNFDGLYLDQIGSFFATRCYNKNHGHTIGGGTYWNDGYHTLIDNVRNRIGPDTILTTESCCETYIDTLDMMLILDQDFMISGIPVLAGMSKQYSVPLFNMIYGDYSISYGSCNNFDVTFPLFEYIMARNLLWGIVPTIEGVTAQQIGHDDAPRRFETIKKITEFYHNHKTIFFYGRLKRIPTVQGKTFQLELPCMLHGSYLIDIPLLTATKWETADGSEKLLCYSFTDQETTFTVDGKDISVKEKGFFIVNET